MDFNFKIYKILWRLNLPIRGVSDEGGCISDTTFIKNVKDIKIVISRVIFSPDSGGK